METKTIHVKPYCMKELAEIYGVSTRTLRAWIQPFKNEIGLQRGRSYTVKQTEIIFKKLGYPYSTEVTDFSSADLF